MKKYINNNRVLEQRHSNSVAYDDADIVIAYTINTPVQNRDKTGDLIVTFDQTLDWIIGVFNVGENMNIFKKVSVTKSISKATKINFDNNGSGNGTIYELFYDNRIYLPQTNTIKSLQISAGTGGGIAAIGIRLKSLFPNLNTYISSIPQPADFSLLDSIPSIRVLDLAISVNNFSNLQILKQSELVALTIRGYNTNTPDILNQLPNTLSYFSTTQMTELQPEISEFFNGNPNRVGLDFSTGQSISLIKYEGSCIFPTILNDNALFKSPYIFRLVKPRERYNMTADQVSKFIVEFANQVTQVNVTNKIIRFGNNVSNPDYIDNTQPLFKTYATALNHITTNLGVTVQWN